MKHARVYWDNELLGYFYQIEGDEPVGPFLTQIAAGTAAREVIVAAAEDRDNPRVKLT